LIIDIIIRVAVSESLGGGKEVIIPGSQDQDKDRNDFLSTVGLNT